MNLTMTVTSRIRTPHASAAVSRVGAGQVVAIRLHHPATGNQINEPMYAHCAERGLMMFELVRNRDTFMRAKSNGRIGQFLDLVSSPLRRFQNSPPPATTRLDSLWRVLQMGQYIYLPSNRLLSLPSLCPLSLRSSVSPQRSPQQTKCLWDDGMEYVSPQW
jgi:hypothetical protein